MIYKKKIITAGLAAAAVGGVLLLHALFRPSVTLAAADEDGRLPPLAEMMADRSVGPKDAPVKLLIFYSFSCRNCAAFNRDVLPQLVEEFAGAGKVQIVFNDFPLTDKALKAAAMSRCVPEKHYRAMVDSLFSELTKWNSAPDIMTALAPYGRLAGLNGAQAANCLQDTFLAEAIKKRRMQYAELYHIDSTPALVVVAGGVGAKLQGYPSFGSVSDAIKAKIQ